MTHTYFRPESDNFSGPDSAMTQPYESGEDINNEKDQAAEGEEGSASEDINSGHINKCARGSDSDGALYSD